VRTTKRCFRGVSVSRLPMECPCAAQETPGPGLRRGAGGAATKNASCCKGGGDGGGVSRCRAPMPALHQTTAPSAADSLLALIAVKMEFITVNMYIPMQHHTAGSGVCRLAGHAQIPPHARYCAGCCLEKKSPCSLQGHRTVVHTATHERRLARMLLRERSRVLQPLFTVTRCQPRRRHCTLRGAPALRR
jgi:hypothetical protein